AWDFGDGNTSTEQNPTHTYLADTTYLVCLVVTNPCSADSMCQTIVVVACTPPVASFTNTQNDLTAMFSDASTNTTSWSWDFDDGNSSTNQNPTYTWAVPGTYNVCLTANSGCATDVTCSSVTVTTCTAVIAVFSSTDNSLTVNFTDMSANAGTWSWDFGDSTTSTLQNPIHTYTAAETYNVCLIASSACSSDTMCFTVTVVFVGIEDQVVGLNMEVYPNPTDGILNVSIPLNVDKDVTFTIHNILGEIVFQAAQSELNLTQTTTGQTLYTLDLGSLSNGTYMLQVQSQDNLFTEQVVFTK
ncbi:MAG: PKD domain-containing protein, partial [Flavobacteriales bacterium]|nr:PKD domain-containing protein [Flavobacteriales bacterium]